MTVSQEELGQRLRAAREGCRMTQEQVAAHLQVSRPTLTQIELGNRAVTSLELDRLAYLFGRDIREFLSPSFAEEDTLAALFRLQAGIGDEPEVIDTLRECMALGRQLTNLESLVGIDRDLTAVAAYPLPQPTNRWDAIQQGERVAEMERRRLGLGSTPAPELTQVLEMQGVRTALLELPDDISGLTLSDGEIGLFIIANETHHVLRRRFSFAHEYAHVLLDRDQAGMISRSSERDDLAEVRANSFAAGFLMPEDGVRTYVATLGKGRPSRSHIEVFDEADSLAAEGRTEPGTQEIQLYDVVQLAHRFCVSHPAAVYRLRNMRLITEAQMERLKVETAERGRDLAALLELPEPDHAEARNWFRHRFLGMALEAFRRDKITHGKLVELAQMVDLSKDRLEKLVEGAGLSVVEQADVLLPDD
jgi:Zn-dependent peptidase ImmA (M78 family)/DNA-binding XRE family transcriptional regulator